MSLSIQEVNDAIAFGNFTDQQLRLVSQAITYRRNLILKANKRQLTVGSNVKFTGRNGRTIVGIVEKINRKYVIVKEQPISGFATNWRVPGNMLEAV